MNSARYYLCTDNKHNGVQCFLCPHECKIDIGQKGLCQVRYNKEGKLKLLNYGQVTAASLDPIEKKPLKKYYPGQKVFSLGTFGCNFSCDFCQNWKISQGEKPESNYLSPEEAVIKAQELVQYGNIGIAYTYSEPLMWFEYVLDTAKLAKEAGLKNILVTNGYINQEPLRELVPYLDAVNLDIKSFTEGFYQKVCGGRLSPVLSNARIFAENCHLEITTLLIPDLNDSVEEIEKLTTFIAEIDKNIPLHLTRYFPNYELQKPSTSLDILYKAKEIADKYLAEVYLGNI
ncbi:MAG: AmmeMemoRadiSam system radical SAM enzyme [Firmicutes bacterium HGW-Firmicutes-12]|nr:MAG: AmmeMemoRadiSam system radical SAM enzyme [Firmicutes bacterium HGW-Firmicutes-12]